MAEKTTIEIRRSTWKALNAEKRGPEDTFDDVANRLLEFYTEVNQFGEPDWDDVREYYRTEEEFEAGKAVYDYVRMGGVKFKSDVLADVMPEHNTGKNSEDNWWRKVVNPLVESGEIEKFNEGGIRIR